jgi:plasmid stabilization system protein ParE
MKRATMPGIGTPYLPRNPAYDGIRYLVLSRFRKHVVFYRDDPPAIRIIRVIHGARNIRNALDEALGIEEEPDP